MFNKLSYMLEDYDGDKHYFDYPFPHIVIENFLTQQQIKKFREWYPTIPPYKDNFYGGYRTDYRLPARGYQQTFNKACEIFKLDQFKDYKVRYGKLISNSVGAKMVTVNAVLSVYNQDKIAGEGATQQFEGLSPHRDREQKMFICLIYLGIPEDELGGDLLLYEAEPSDERIRKLQDIKLAKTIPYAPGTLVMFPNSRTSVHSVGDRKVGDINRMMLCITFENYSREWISMVKDPNKSLEFKEAEKVVTRLWGKQ